MDRRDDLWYNKKGALFGFRNALFLDDLTSASLPNIQQFLINILASLI